AGVERIEEDLHAVDEREDRRAVALVNRIGAREVRLVECEVGRVEHDVHRRAHVRVAADQLGERVALELLVQVDAVVVLTPFTITFAHGVVPVRKATRSAGAPTPPLTISRAALRLQTTVLWPVMLGCLPYAATKLTN